MGVLFKLFRNGEFKMLHNNNVNDNGGKLYLPNNDIDNDKYNKGKQVDVLADQLVMALNVDPVKSRPFMCKVAYKLSEAKIWNNLEKAQKGSNPVGLFIWLCKKDGV